MIFTAQERRSLAQRFNSRFHESRGSRWFAVDAAELEGYTWVQVLLRNDANSFHYPVEARIATSTTRPQLAQAFFLLAFINSYWEEFFAEDENVFIPIDWSPYEHQGEKFHLRGQVFNRRIEKMADELLAEQP